MVTDGVVLVAFLGAVALAANKTVSVIKALVNRDRNGWFTPAVALAVSGVAVVLLCHAGLTEAATIPTLGVRFGSLDGWSQALFAWTLAGPTTFSFDIRKAFDNADSAKEAPLVKAKAPQPQ